MTSSLLLKIGIHSLELISASGSYSEDTLCPSVQMEAVFKDFWQIRRENEMVFNGLLPATLTYKGKNVCQGYFDTYGYSDKTVKISMRNRASLIVDSSLELPYKQKQKANLKGIIDETAALYGLKVIDETDGFAAKSIIELFTYEVGTKAFDVLDRITNEKGINITSTPEGDLILKKGYPDSDPVPMVNIERIDFNRDNTGLFGSYYVVVSSENKKGGLKNKQHKVVSDYGNNRKVWIEYIDNQDETVNPKEILDHELKTRIHNAETFNVKTACILQGNKMLQVGDSVSFQYKSKVYKMRIKGFSWNATSSDSANATYQMTNLEGLNFASAGNDLQEDFLK